MGQFFRLVCKTRADDPDARGCLAVNSIATLVGTDETIGPKIEKAIHSRIECFENILQLAADKGEIKATDLHAKALALQNLLMGLNMMAKVVRDENELWALTKQTLQGLGLFKSEPVLVMNK